MKLTFTSLFLISSMILSFASGEVGPKTLSFPEVWTQVNSSSAVQQASRLQVESLQESRDRATRHWLPRVYLEGKGYQTNDSGNSFLGLLEQRSLMQSDFNTDSINNPGTHFYTRGALGLDFPLYEGGLKTVQVDYMEHAVSAQSNTTMQVQLEQYSQVGLAYASIGIISLQREKLSDLTLQVDRLLKNYQLGNKSNPVGYSGLLGMQALANRLNAQRLQYDSQIQSSMLMLREMGVRAEAWSADVKSATHFVDQFFAFDPKSPANSYGVQAVKENVRANGDSIKIEKSKFLPRVGAFAESSLFNGSRSTANSYTAGVYLQWNLFDPSAYGSVTEARLKSEASRKSLDAVEQRENSEKIAFIEMAKVARENIELLNESSKILLEQSKVTETLFRNGSINALQVVEILNRRADLIVQQGEVELGLVRAATGAVVKEKFDISQHILNH